MYRSWKYSTIIAGILVAAVLVCAPQLTHAFVIEGEECGLVVTPAEGYTDVTNLNPGDVKSSYLIASNEGEEDLEYYFNLRKIASSAGYYPGVEGRHLDEVMEFAISSGRVVLFEGLLEEFAEEIYMGWLSPGESQRIDITTYLPGEATGNAFQGASVTIQFEFRAVCDGTPTRRDRAYLTVRKFHDVNQTGDFAPDDGDEWIEGWPIMINNREYTTPITSLRVRPGTYVISEVGRPDWTATTPTTVTVRLSDRDRKTVDFGNHRGSDDPDDPEPGTGRLIVRKFHDLDGDGIWDAEDPEIVDWIVYVNGEPHRTPVRLRLETGTYEVSEEWDEDEWTATTPTTVTVDLDEDEAETVIFGNQQLEDAVIPPPAPEAPPTWQLPTVFFYVTGFMLVFAGLVVAQRVRR